MTTALHEQDFYAWTQRQAALLKNEDYAELDLTNLVEEIEEMGNNRIGNFLAYSPGAKG